MRELALTGFLAIVFGLGAFYATQHFGAFSIVNLVVGCVALVIAIALGARRLRFVGGRHSRPVILRGLLLIVGALVLAVAAERLVASANIRFDWTFERRYELSPATLKVLAELPGEVSATLYAHPGDPRRRRTRLLIEQLATAGPVRTAESDLGDSPRDEDRFGVSSSNTVVLQLGDRFERVDRPNEATFYEALYRLRSVRTGTLLLLQGEGEGDPLDESDLGYSGLAAALQTEGYELRSVVSAALSEVPEDTDAVVLIAPQRRLLDGALGALRRYLERGGRLVALLEPGVESGVEELLAEYGLATPEGVLVDPASGGAGGSSSAGVDPVAYNYQEHPISKGLNSRRMTYFSGARSFTLRKPRPDDQLSAVVLSSPRAWLSDDPSALQRRFGGLEPDGAPQTYHPLVVAGRYPRDGGEVRIVASGDSDFASNRYLRVLYNLDLVLNAVHWAVERESEITLRPKIRDTIQFPLPLQNSLRTLYSVGLLLPELLLIAGGIVWLRRRVA
ncbi:MAG: DUF4350 domain-containing protein [Myxococcota bacterium]